MLKIDLKCTKVSLNLWAFERQDQQNKYIMTKNKSFIAPPYVEPACKIIDVKLDRSLMQVSGNIDPWVEDNNPLGC